MKCDVHGESDHRDACIPCIEGLNERWNTWELRARAALRGLRFISDLCAEALEDARVGSGEEVALRHAHRRAEEEIAKMKPMTVPTERPKA